MKKLLLLATIAVIGIGSANAEAPFGLRVGMSLNDIKAVSGSMEKLDNTSYVIKKVPKPYDGFKDYVIMVTPKNGLCKVVGFGKDVRTSAYGDGVRSEFEALSDGLQKKYGKPTDNFNFLRSGSIWKDPRDWMMSLLKEERHLMATWEPNEVDGIKNIMLKARAKTRDIGYVTLAYELSNATACYDEREDKDISGL